MNVASSPGLRFSIGDRVECNVGDGLWEPGKIIKVEVTLDSGKEVPYQVKLDNGQSVSAPVDSANVIREVKFDINNMFGLTPAESGGIYTEDVAISESDLQAIFYSIDADGSGEIDLEELTAALSDLGFELPDDKVAALFKEYGIIEELGGERVISYDSFKRLVIALRIQPARNVKFAMDLFRKYDDDGSGSIDKFEFKEIVSEIEKDQERRTGSVRTQTAAIAGIAGAAAGVLVATNLL